VGTGYRRFHSSFDLVTVAIVVALVVAAVAAVRVRRRRVASPVE
jgi:subtilase family serine protease